MSSPVAGLADGGCKFPTETAASTRKRNRGPRGVALGPTAILRTRSMRTRASSRPWLPSASPTNALMRLRDLTWETCSPRLSECSYPTTTEAGAVTFVQDSSKSYGCRDMRCKAIASADAVQHTTSSRQKRSWSWPWPAVPCPAPCSALSCPALPCTALPCPALPCLCQQAGTFADQCTFLVLAYGSKHYQADECNLSCET